MRSAKGIWNFNFVSVIELLVCDALSPYWESRDFRGYQCQTGCVGTLVRFVDELGIAIFYVTNQCAKSRVAA